MYRALFITVCACGLVTMVNCAFACGSRSLCNMIFYYTCIFALCTEFTVFRFASHIFSVVPCMVHSDFAYAAYSSWPICTVLAFILKLEEGVCTLRLFG